MSRPRRTIDELLEEARRDLSRVGPQEAREAVREGAVLIDIRSDHQRAKDGIVPEAIHHPRNVLEWRCDPDSDHRDPRIGGLDRHVIVMCNEGYASSLSAVVLRRLGLHRATDLDGGHRAWKAAQG